MMFTFLHARCLHTHRLVSRPLGSHTSTSARHVQINIRPYFAGTTSLCFFKKLFRKTVELSYGREGDRFRMTVEPSYGRERVNDVITAEWRVREPPYFLEEDGWSISAGHFTPVNHIRQFERFLYHLTPNYLLFPILMDNI